MSSDQPIVNYRDIQGYPGYRVGDDGSVWSCLRRRGRGHGHLGGTYTEIGDEWKQLKPKRNKCGKKKRLMVTLNPETPGGKKDHYVHQLVLTAFVGPCPEGLECCHKDNDATNNRLSNLRWGTHASNMADNVAAGNHAHGEKCSYAKLTEDAVRDIRRRRALVPPVPLTVLAAEYSVSFITISDVARRATWKHVT